jgi:flagellar motor switch protein FliG
MSSKKSPPEIKIDGKKEAALLLASLDEANRERILSDIAKTDPELAKTLRENLVDFSQVLALESVSLQKVLKGFPQDFIAKSVRGLDEKDELIFFSKLSDRQARAIKEERDSMGPQRLSDVKAAREKIIEKAKELESAGELSLRYQPKI